VQAFGASALAGAPNPTLLKVQNFGEFKPESSTSFEVGYKSFKKGEIFEPHFHKIGTEISLLTKGEMIMQDKKITAGDIFVIPPYEVADTIFLTDCEILAIKVPSNTNDKFYTESND
jgi:quercetin dioxygenase-like cupin family protein